MDNLLEKVVQVSKGEPESQLLRVGSSTWMVREELRKFTLESRYAKLSEGKRVRENWMDKRIVKKILKEARIVCTTCISAGSKILEDVKFSRLLVDEASQATEPAILVPICRGKLMPFETIVIHEVETKISMKCGYLLLAYTQSWNSAFSAI